MSVSRWPSLLEMWSKIVFQKRHSEITPKIRVLRAVEEMLELAQSENVTSEEIDIIKNQVYTKPVGHPKQELGGVLVCLSGYAATVEFDLEEVFWEEFTRMMTPEVIERVRYRNLEGDKIGFDKKNSSDDVQ